MLDSPRTLAQAQREMLAVALARATDEEIKEVMTRLGPWVMEQVLDAAKEGTEVKVKEPIEQPQRQDQATHKNRCIPAEHAARIRQIVADGGFSENDLTELGIPWKQTKHILGSCVSVYAKHADLIEKAVGERGGVE